MDPDVALENARDALKKYRQRYGGSTEVHAENLADAFEALDEWLTKGGFLPADWQKPEMP